MTSRTLNAVEAAQLLHIHPQTLKSRARAGLIPGCRVGKAWVFVESLLIEYLVAQSLSRVSVAGTQEKPECRSTEEKTRLSGGSNCRLSAANLALYRSALLGRVPRGCKMQQWKRLSPYCLPCILNRGLTLPLRKFKKPGDDRHAEAAPLE